jgi:hypothetical protein
MYTLKDTSKRGWGKEQLRKTFDKTYGIKLKENMLWHTWELWEHTQLRACLAKHLGIDIKVHLG